jgi:uncharacterized Zn finger protein (UPF0148 family)
MNNETTTTTFNPGVIYCPRCQEKEVTFMTKNAAEFTHEEDALESQQADPEKVQSMLLERSREVCLLKDRLEKERLLTDQLIDALMGSWEFVPKDTPADLMVSAVLEKWRIMRLQAP